MTYSDTNLTCRDCGTEFPVTAFEQEFYDLNHFSYEVERCRECRRKRQQSVTPVVKASMRTTRAPRPMKDAACFVCGKSTSISFAPRFGKPVYCPRCYERYGSRHAAWGPVIVPVQPG